MMVCITIGGELFAGMLKARPAQPAVTVLYVAVTVLYVAVTVLYVPNVAHMRQSRPDSCSRPAPSRLITCTTVEQTWHI